MLKGGQIGGPQLFNRRGRVNAERALAAPGQSRSSGGRQFVRLTSTSAWPPAGFGTVAPPCEGGRTTSDGPEGVSDRATASGQLHRTALDHGARHLEDLGSPGLTMGCRQCVLNGTLAHFIMG